MINNIKKWTLALGSVLALNACSDFEEINVNPVAANEDQVQVEYFINNSITGAQQNPHVSERAFVLYWKAAGRMDRTNSLPVGYYSDGWTNDYFNSISGWLNHAYTAVQIADNKIESGNINEYTNNLKQVARIWRVYLLSEMTDNFGPIAINGYQGENPDFNSVEEVYDFMLTELKQAVADMDEGVTAPSNVQELDPAYGYNFDSWKKYANSMRMRLAMRLSQVDEARAQAEFEDAVSGQFISTWEESFKVAEKPGWDDLTGVMTREWNMQYLSPTLNNLMIGLGGISSEELLPADLHEHIKSEDYFGKKYENHFTTLTNDPSAGYWFDGLHAEMDPRAYEAYIVPGWFDNPEMNRYPSYAPETTGTTKRNLMNGEEVVEEIEAAFTWNAPSIGDWGEKGSKNQVYGWAGALPRLAHRFRNSSSERVFFGAWESYFLIAEAAVRGWSVPHDGQTAYEEGVKQSFAYWNVSSYVEDYLISDDYNRVGTSVNWNHTAEPTDKTVTYINGYNGNEETTTFSYPDNHLYKNGSVKNDHLTKIITQKFIAQTPWLPLETWNDHRRLGLPFFENPAIENSLPNLPALDQSNYTESRQEFFPQRLKYPGNLQNNVPEGYQQAVNHLGGDDSVLTPLWWARPE